MEPVTAGRPPGPPGTSGEHRGAAGQGWPLGTGGPARRRVIAALVAAIGLAATGCARPATEQRSVSAGAAVSVPSPTSPPAPTATPPAAPTPTPTPVPRPTRTPVRRIVQTPVPTFAPMELPVWIDIPGIAVHAPIIELGVTPDGEVEAPPGPKEVGWLRTTPRPGDPGNSFLTGHLDLKTETAVFWRLREVKPGERVTILTQARPVDFTVETTDVYRTAEAPVARILGFVVGRVVTLLTCEGTFDRATRDYSHRRVVRARLV